METFTEQDIHNVLWGAQGVPGAFRNNGSAITPPPASPDMMAPASAGKAGGGPVPVTPDGVFNNASLNKYGGAKSGITDAQNAAIAQSNNAEAMKYIDDVAAVRAAGGDINKAAETWVDKTPKAVSAAPDMDAILRQWKDAIKSVGIGATTGGIKYRTQMAHALQLLNEIGGLHKGQQQFALGSERNIIDKMDAGTRAETAAGNLANSQAQQALMAEKVRKAAPETIQGGDEFMMWDAEKGKYVGTGIKTRTKEYKPESKLDQIKTLSEIEANYTRNGLPAPDFVSRIRDEVLGAGKQATATASVYAANDIEAELKRRGLK